MTRNVYQVLESQFPQHIRDNPNYAKFIDLIKDYYKFVSFVDIKDEVDLDKTNYISKFIDLYARNFPELNKLEPAQQRVVLENISDLYKSKGSVEAYNLIFSLLYNTNVEIFYPSTQIFKPSAAQWNRDVSVRFKLVQGFLTAFENVQAVITTVSGVTTNVDIIKIVKLDGTPDIFECFIAADYKLIINEDATLSAETFSGPLVKSVVKKTIISQGVGYAVGDIFNLDDNGTQIKVTKTTPESGLKAFQILKYGNGYVDNFEINIATNAIITQLLDQNLTIQQLDALNALYNEVKLSTDDKVNNIIERLLIVRFDYIDNPNYYEDNTYVGELLRTVNASTSAEQVQTNFNARVFFELGYVFEYPGYYSTNVGFPSDTSFIQDGEYYQQFSYVIKTTEQYENYVESVNTLVHPAGLRMFGEYVINRELNILIDIMNKLSLLDFTLQELVEANDEVTKVVLKNIEETAISADILFKTIEKPITDNYNVSDTVFKSVGKIVTDLQSTTDELTKQVQKIVFDIANVTDSVTKSVSKSVLDEAMVPDEGCLILNGYYLASEVAPYNGTYWKCGYAAGETYFGSDVLMSIGNDDVLAADSGNEFKING